MVRTRPYVLICSGAPDNSYAESGKQKKFKFTQWPSEFTANQCQLIGPIGQIGQHSLAGISESRRGK